MCNEIKQNQNFAVIFYCKFLKKLDDKYQFFYIEKQNNSKPRLFKVCTTRKKRSTKNSDRNASRIPLFMNWNS